MMCAQRLKKGLAIAIALALVALTGATQAATSSEERTLTGSYVGGWERFALLVCPEDQTPDPNGVGTVCIEDPFQEGDEWFEVNVVDDVGMNVPFTYRIWAGDGTSFTGATGSGCGSTDGSLENLPNLDNIATFEVVLWGASGQVGFCPTEVGTGAIAGEVELTVHDTPFE